MAASLNRIFVYVPANEVAAFKEGAGKTQQYKGRISFLAGTGEIMTNGEIFAMNKEAGIQALRDLLGTDAAHLSENLTFDADTIVGAIKYVYDLANAEHAAIEDRLDTIEGEQEGSIKKAVNDAVTALLNGAPDALDTLKEIADWISKDDGLEAANLVTRMENIEAQVDENEEVISNALIDLQKQIDDMTGGAGSIQQQITTNLETLDGSVTLAGTTASQPQNVGIDTSIDVLGSVTVGEVDGIIRQAQSAKTVLQADAYGAARKAFDVLYGDANTDTTDSMTLTGVRARIDYLRRTGTLSVSNDITRVLEFDDSQDSHLVTGENLRDTINSIEMWENYTSQP